MESLVRSGAATARSAAPSSRPHSLVSRQQTHPYNRSSLPPNRSSQRESTARELGAVQSIRTQLRESDSAGPRQDTSDRANALYENAQETMQSVLHEQKQQRRLRRGDMDENEMTMPGYSPGEAHEDNEARHLSRSNGSMREKNSSAMEDSPDYSGSLDREEDPDEDRASVVLYGKLGMKKKGRMLDLQSGQDDSYEQEQEQEDEEDVSNECIPVPLCRNKAHDVFCPCCLYASKKDSAHKSIVDKINKVCTERYTGNNETVFIDSVYDYYNLTLRKILKKEWSKESIREHITIVTGTTASVIGRQLIIAESMLAACVKSNVCAYDKSTKKTFLVEKGANMAMRIMAEIRKIQSYKVG